MQAPPTPSVLASASQVVYLLSLSWGGRVYRIATRPLTVTDNLTGQAMQFSSGLTEIPDAEEQVDREGVGEGGASVPMTIYLDGTDIAERIAQGHRLDGARGELAELHLSARMEPLEVWSRRTILVSQGRLLQPVLAGADTSSSALVFSLEEILQESTQPLLDPAAVIDENTWPQSLEAVIGKSYPVVLGAPGAFRKDDGSTGQTSGSPAYPVTYTSTNIDYLLICDGEVEASTVRVYDDSGGDDALTVSTVLDGRGRRVSVVDLGSSSLSRTDTEYWVEWTSPGLIDPVGGGGIQTLGQALLWAAMQMRSRVDLAAWLARQSGALSAIRVGTYINDPELTPQQFMSSMLEAVPSVSVRNGPSGLYPHVRLLNQPDGDGVMHVTEGGDFRAATELTTQTSPADVRNTFTVRFAPRAKTGAYRRYVRCAPRIDPGNRSDFTTAYAQMSASRHGSAHAETLEVPWIYDEASAARIAAEHVRLRGFAYATRTYRADWRYGWLEVGMMIRLTSASLHMTDVQVEIIGKAHRIGGYEFLLAFDDDPLRLGSKRAS